MPNYIAKAARLRKAVEKRTTKIDKLKAKIELLKTKNTEALEAVKNLEKQQTALEKQKAKENLKAKEKPVKAPKEENKKMKISIKKEVVK